MADVEAKATKFAVEQISRGGGERSNLNIVGVGGITSTCVQCTRVSFMIEPHPQIVFFATSDGEAKRMVDGTCADSACWRLCLIGLSNRMFWIGCL